MFLSLGYEGRGLLEGFAKMDRCEVKGCGRPADNGVTYGNNKKNVCLVCWYKHSDHIIDLKSPDAFVGGPAIFSRTDPARRQTVVAAPVASLF